MSCKNCEYCKMIYSRGCYSFSKIKVYYCVKNEIVLEGDIGNKKCKNWLLRKPKAIDLTDQRFEEVKQAIVGMLDSLKEFD